MKVRCRQAHSQCLTLTYYVMNSAVWHLSFEHQLKAMRYICRFTVIQMFTVFNKHARPHFASLAPILNNSEISWMKTTDHLKKKKCFRPHNIVHSKCYAFFLLLLNVGFFGNKFISISPENIKCQSGLSLSVWSVLDCCCCCHKIYLMRLHFLFRWR